MAPGARLKKGTAMTHRVCVLGLILGTLAGVVDAAEYDFFRLARYPAGGKLRPGVESYEVKEAGGAPQEYRRRVVRWWPRRGVDIIAVEEAMPEREWTFQRAAVDAKTGEVTGPSDAELLAWGLPRTFTAHLIGFDGIGNDIGDPYAGEDFVEPSVILRMADGSKRSFQSKTFCQADREFILDVYVKEMKRITGTLDQTEYSVQPRTRQAYPGGTPIGQPGSLLLQSEHFVVPSGSQSSDPEGGRWLNPKRPEVAARLRECVFNMFEHMHAYLEYGGHLMPYWDRQEKYKYEVHVGGTILDGFKKKGGGAGGGYGGQGMGWLGSTPGGFGHEYGHGMSIQWRFGNGEILAQSMMELTDNRCTSYHHNVLVPWRNCMHAEYNSCLFYRTPGDDPNWGLLFVTAVPGAAEERLLFQTLARVGEQRGMFEDGIRGLGDLVGDYSARLPEFDTQNQYPMRTWYFAAARNYLEPVDVENGVYRIPWDEAPEPFGANMVRLLPEEGSEAIEVDFQGHRGGRQGRQGPLQRPVEQGQDDDAAPRGRPALLAHRGGHAHRAAGSQEGPPERLSRPARPALSVAGCAGGRRAGHATPFAGRPGRRVRRLRPRGPSAGYGRVELVDVDDSPRPAAHGRGQAVCGGGQIGRRRAAAAGRKRIAAAGRKEATAEAR